MQLLLYATDFGFELYLGPLQACFHHIHKTLFSKILKIL